MLLSWPATLQIAKSTDLGQVERLHRQQNLSHWGYHVFKTIQTGKRRQKVGYGLSDSDSTQIGDEMSSQKFAAVRHLFFHILIRWSKFNMNLHLKGTQRVDSWYPRLLYSLLITLYDLTVNWLALIEIPKSGTILLESLEEMRLRVGVVLRCISSEHFRQHTTKSYSLKKLCVSIGWSVWWK